MSMPRACTVTVGPRIVSGVTEPSRADAGEHDELAEAAAREYADRLSAHRRLRAWLMSATASALLILLALTVLRPMPPRRESCHDWANRFAAKVGELWYQSYFRTEPTEPIAEEVDQIWSERPPGCEPPLSSYLDVHH
jgi:hypothetical protein